MGACQSSGVLAFTVPGVQRTVNIYTEPTMTVREAEGPVFLN